MTIHLFIVTLFLAILYYLTGWLGLFLAIPPGYATIFWPASGIALSFVYRYGWRVAPGVFIGSVTLNFFTYISKAPVEQFPVLALNAVSIGFGSTIQACIGAFLIRYKVGSHTSLEKMKEILAYISLGGMLSGLIACTWGVSTLVITNSIELKDTFFSWITWYVGDVLGIVVFSPLLTIIFNRNIKIKRKWQIGIPLILIFLSAIFLFSTVKSINDKHAKNEFHLTALRIGSEVEQEFNTNLQQLYSLRDFFESSSDVTSNEFSGFSRNLLARNDAFVAVSWLPICLRHRGLKPGIL